jgi:hypothetical protein
VSINNWFEGFKTVIVLLISDLITNSSLDNDDAVAVVVFFNPRLIGLLKSNL